MNGVTRGDFFVLSCVLCVSFSQFFVMCAVSQATCFLVTVDTDPQHGTHSFKHFTRYSFLTFKYILAFNESMVVINVYED